MCLDAQGGIKQSANPMWLLECGLVNVFQTSSTRFHCIALQQLLIHGHWNVRILAESVSNKCQASVPMGMSDGVMTLSKKKSEI